MTFVPLGAQFVEAGGSEYLTRAQALIDSLQKGQSDEGARLLDELTALRETQRYQQNGYWTHELHAFFYDTRVNATAHEEIFDARERRPYVITLMHESTGQTLTAVEQPVF